MKVGIVILHYGDIETTKECIESLYAVEKYPFSLYLVSNTKEPLDERKFTRRNIVLINNHANLGFAKGVNVGIKTMLKEGVDAILLLNNDTIITKPLIGKLVSALTSSPMIGISAPAIRFYKGKKTLYDLGGKLQKVFGRTSHTEVQTLQGYQVIYPDYASGCCMMIKKEVFKKIGYFDEQFFLYYEDVDFCLRTKDSGYRIVVDPSVTIDHALSKSAGKMSSFATYHQIRSAISFGKKYFPNPFLRIPQVLFILLQVLLFLKANPKGGMGGVKALTTFVTKSTVRVNN